MAHLHRSHRWIKLTTAGIAALVAGVGLFGLAHPAGAAEKQVDFNRDIKPIFTDSCVKCHSLNNPRKKAASGLRLDTRAGAMKGGDNGKDIIPGKGKESLLYRLLQGSVTVDGEDVDAMPKHKKGEKFKPLSHDKVELIKDWIDQGAKWGE